MSGSAATGRSERGVGSALRAAAGGALWWWRSLLGDNDYRRYLVSMARAHPTEPVMSEREFWRHKHSGDIGPRCC